MAIHNYNGIDYDLPDTWSEEKVSEFLASRKQEAQPSDTAPSGEAPQAVANDEPQQPQLEATITQAPVIKKQSELHTDPYFVAAAKYLRNKEMLLDKEVERLQMQINDPMSTPLEREVADKALRLKMSRDKFTGTDEEYAEWGMRRMGQFLYNLPRMSIDAATIRYSEDQSEKEAFLYLMEAYDRTDPTLEGFARWAAGAMVDPTTYVGIGSLGAGLLARSAGQQMTKEGLKALLKEGVRVGTIAAIDTAMIAGAQDNLKQSIEISAGAKKETDWSQTAKAAGIGGLFGFGLGGALGAGAAWIGQRASKLATSKGGTKTPDTPETLSLKAEADEIHAETGVEAPSLPKENTITQAGEAAATELPTGSGNKAFDDLVAAIKSVVPERLQDGTVARLSPEEIANTVINVSRTLKDLKLADAQNLEGALRNVGMTNDQMSALKMAAQQAFEQSDDTSKQLYQAVVDAVGDDAKAAATKAWDEFEMLRSQLGNLDVTLSSRSGSDLGSRVGGKYVGENRGLGRDQILRDMGIDPKYATLEQKLAAQEKFNQLEARIQEAIDADRRIQELTDEYYRLIEEGQPGAADKVFVEREALKEQVAKLQENASFGRNMYGWFNKYFANPANEIAIANVFSPATMIVNIIPAFVKTAYKPIVNAIVKGGLADSIALKEASFFYSALAQSREMAWNAAKAAFRYERSLISSDPARVIEHNPSIPGLTGRIIRTIPRMVAAADEFVKRANYTAYVAHQAYGDALAAGAERGYKGKDLEDFARNAADEALKNAFERAPAEDVSALIARDADLRGLQGAEREAYINERFAQDGELFARMKSGPAKDFAENMTFTKPFSGENAASSAAKGVEQFLQRNPVYKLAFQLFWRTPIRIYEEGIRLTPGINLIAPNFMADLRGVNGPAAQIKAQGEAMLSIAWSSSFFTMYGNGTYVGNGPADPKLRQAWIQAGNTPNTIVFPNGKKLDINRLEPFNVPFKLMGAAMDRVRELEYRKRQGEYVEKDMKEALAWMGVATGTAASIFHDANIAGGIEAYMKLLEYLSDPEKSEQALQQFVADKARMGIPSIYTKAMQQFGSGLDLPQFTPYTLEQMIMTRINPASKEIPLKFDVIGNPITTSYSSEWEKSLRLWANIGVQTGDPHFDKLSPQQQYILKQTEKLQYAIGESLQMPYKVKAFGDFDLRSTKTADGKDFYYNRIQRYAVELGMHEALEQAYRQMEGVPKGRKSIDGIQPMIIKNIFSQFRNAAIMKVIQEESGLRQRFIQQKLEQSRTQQGNYDVLSQPY